MFLIFSAAAAFLLEHPSLEGDTPPAKKRRSVSKTLADDYRDVDGRGELNTCILLTVRTRSISL